jgi:hypothetical protein
MVVQVDSNCYRFHIPTLSLGSYDGTASNFTLSASKCLISYSKSCPVLPTEHDRERALFANAATVWSAP